MSATTHVFKVVVYGAVGVTPPLLAVVDNANQTTLGLSEDRIMKVGLPSI